MNRPRITIIAVAASLIFLSGCGGGSARYVPVANSGSDDDWNDEDSISPIASVISEPEVIEPISIERNDDSFEIPFKLNPSGVKTIYVKFNDVAGFDAILDTGCSGLTISLQEAYSLAKSGTLTEQDGLGTSYSTVATGQVVANGVYNIHELSIQDTEGRQHTIYDIPATVMQNPTAPILIGNVVLDQFAANRYTIDLNNGVIRFE